MILNSVFKDTVVVNSDEEFDGCEFVSGTTAKQKNVFGLAINGNANVTVKNCKFANKGYSAVYVNSTGKVNIENNEIDCTGLYNPIEGGSGTNTAKLVDVTVKGNVLSGICGNNYFNFYHFSEDGATINIEDNTVKGMSQQAEVIRISNLEDGVAIINVKNMKYSYDMSTVFDENWTKMLLFQDYTKDAIQDFSKITVNIDGVECNGQEVTDKEKFPVGGLICVYDSYKSANGESQFPTTNMPVINFN